MTQDYVGSFNTDHGSDVLHYGVKGMKWGVRRYRSPSGKLVTRQRSREIAGTAKSKEAAALNARIDRIKSGSGKPLVVNGKELSKKQSVDYLQKRADKLEKKADKLLPKPKEEAPAPKSSGKDAETVTLSDGTKLSIEKKAVANMDFNALRTQVREKGANSLTDDELKYVNTRTEAVRKANDAYKKPDSWLAKTVKDTVQSSLQKQMKKTSDTAADHFGDKLRDHLKTRLKTKTKKGTAKTSTGNVLPVVYKVTSIP